MGTGGDEANGDDEEVHIIMCNDIINVLVEGLEREIALDVFRLGELRWWNQRLRISFGLWLGRRLTAWRKLKGEKRDVVWCK